MKKLIIAIATAATLSGLVAGGTVSASAATAGPQITSVKTYLRPVDTGVQRFVQVKGERFTVNGKVTVQFVDLNINAPGGARPFGRVDVTACCGATPNGPANLENPNLGRIYVERFLGNSRCGHLLQVSALDRATGRRASKQFRVVC
jgi:hypothetical protein